MRNTTMILATAAALLVTAGLCAPEAHAQTRRQGTRILKRAPTSSRSGSSIRSRSSGSGLSRMPTMRSSPSSRGGSSPFGGLLGRGRDSSSLGRSDRPGLTALGNLLDGIQGDRGSRYDGRYGGRYDSDKAMASAYRDAAIANAVVGLVGIFVEAGTRNQCAVQPAQPTGHYETHRVILQPGRYLQDRVWVPERYDPNTGRKLGGGYQETHTQWIPETVEYRQVYVPR